ncbi:MAG: cupredoxin domain-containing protein [Chloroflexota bacterium]|nr:cupredoxin domain-containing protein [Chloroflexota bacterium]
MARSTTNRRCAGCWSRRTGRANAAAETTGELRVGDRLRPTPPPPDCGDVTPVAVASDVGALTVTGAEFRFDPAELRVGAGERVSLTFENAGTIPHTFTIPDFEVDTGSVAAAPAATMTITAPDTAGSHEFLCTFGGHPELGMVGTLIVE